MIVLGDCESAAHTQYLLVHDISIKTSTVNNNLCGRQSAGTSRMGRAGDWIIPQ